MPICGGWAFLCMSVHSQTSVRPLVLPISSKATLAPSPPFPSRSPFPKTKTGHYRITMIPTVAGCTTGSLCPRCPYIRDEVLSLYQAEFLSTLATLLLVARRFSILENITRSVAQVPYRRGGLSTLVLLASTASFRRPAAHCLA